MSDFFWFSDTQWARIEPLLPTDVRGKARVDDRRVLSWIVSTAAKLDAPPKPFRHPRLPCHWHGQSAPTRTRFEWRVFAEPVVGNRSPVRPEVVGRRNAKWGGDLCGLAASGECQEFRVRGGIMGKRTPYYGTTQSPLNP